jgi:hypothetical protein
LPRSGDPQLSQIIAGDLRASIKKILLDESLPPDNMSARSATEIAERMKELSQNLGSAFGRLINETMYPIIRRTLETMDSLGMIDLPLKVNGLQVKVVPSAPLAQAQNMEKVSEVLQFAQIVQQTPMGPFVLKQDAFLDYLAKSMAIPSEMITSPMERMEMQKQAQAMAQAQEQNQQMTEQRPNGASPEDQAVN